MESYVAVFGLLHKQCPHEKKDCKYEEYRQMSLYDRYRFVTTTTKKNLDEMLEHHIKCAPYDQLKVYQR